MTADKTLAGGKKAYTQCDVEPTATDRVGEGLQATRPL